MAPPSAVASRAISRAPSVLEPAAAAPPSAVASRAVSRAPSILEPAAVAADVIILPDVDADVAAALLDLEAVIPGDAENLKLVTQRLKSALFRIQPISPPSKSSSGINHPHMLEPNSEATSEVAAVAPPSAVASRTVSRTPSVLEPTVVALPSSSSGSVEATASMKVSRTVSRSVSSLQPVVETAGDDEPDSELLASSSKATAGDASTPLDPAVLAAAMTAMVRRSVSRAASNLNLSRRQTDTNATEPDAVELEAASGANAVLSGALKNLESLLLHAGSADMNQIKAAMQNLEVACQQVFEVGQPAGSVEIDEEKSAEIVVDNAPHESVEVPQGASEEAQEADAGTLEPSLFFDDSSGPAAEKVTSEDLLVQVGEPSFSAGLTPAESVTTAVAADQQPVATTLDESRVPLQPSSQTFYVPALRTALNPSLTLASAAADLLQLLSFPGGGASKPMLQAAVKKLDAAWAAQNGPGPSPGEAGWFHKLTAYFICIIT